MNTLFVQILQKVMNTSDLIANGRQLRNPLRRLIGKSLNDEIYHKFLLKL